MSDYDMPPPKPLTYIARHLIVVLNSYVFFTWN